jgi:hypothetical protein
MMTNVTIQHNNSANFQLFAFLVRHAPSSFEVLTMRPREEPLKPFLLTIKNQCMIPYVTILAGALLCLSISVAVPQGTALRPGAARTNLRARNHGISEKELQLCCSRLQKDHRRIYYLVSRRARMDFQVKGIYSREKLLFFRLSLGNHSHLDYDVDSIRFLVKDRKLTKASFTTARFLPVLYTYGNARSIKGKSREECVIVLPQFTLPDGKRLVVEVTEKNGGRRLQLFIDNFTLLRSRPA